jgi:hypothetical protein
MKKGHPLLKSQERLAAIEKRNKEIRDSLVIFGSKKAENMEKSSKEQNAIIFGISHENKFSGSPLKFKNMSVSMVPNAQQIKQFLDWQGNNEKTKKSRNSSQGVLRSLQESRSEANLKKAKEVLELPKIPRAKSRQILYPVKAPNSQEPLIACGSERFPRILSYNKNDTGAGSCKRENFVGIFEFSSVFSKIIRK